MGAALQKQVTEFAIGFQGKDEDQIKFLVKSTYEKYMEKDPNTYLMINDWYNDNENDIQTHFANLELMWPSDKNSVTSPGGFFDKLTPK